jgi:hypothetical protein
MPEMRQLTTDQKGAIAEAGITYAAVQLGIDVYRPIFEGGRYDLIFDLCHSLLRVQCTWAPRRRDVIVVRCYSCCRTRDGFVRRSYTAHEVDAIAAYCPDNGTCYLMARVASTVTRSSRFACARAGITSIPASTGHATSSSIL